MPNVEMRGAAGSIMVPAEAVDRYRGRGYVVVSADPATVRQDLDAHSIKELREMAKARGLRVSARADKPTIIDAILRAEMSISKPAPDDIDDVVIDDGMGRVFDDEDDEDDEEE